MVNHKIEVLINVLLCVSYIISSAVCPFISENSQNEAQILLLTGQGLVVETVVSLLVTQGEASRKWRQPGSYVRLGRIQMTFAPQDRAFTWLEQLWKTRGVKVKVKFGNKSRRLTPDLF